MIKLSTIILVSVLVADVHSLVELNWRFCGLTHVRRVDYNDSATAPASRAALGRLGGGSSKETGQNQWPWLAALVRRYSSGYHQVCTAALITTRWLVTAGHCLIQQNQYGFVHIPLQDLKVSLGERVITSESQLWHIERIVPHPELGLIGNFSINDIGLIKTRSVMWFNVTNSNPPDAALYQFTRNSLCLAAGQNPFDSSDRNFTFTGFGMVINPSQNTPRNVTIARQTLYVRLADHSRCYDLIRLDEPGTQVIQQQIPSTAFCSRHDNQRAFRNAFCKGDFGGPLTFFDPNIAQHVIIGVAAWATYMDVNMDFQYRCGIDAVFTRIQDFQQWIKSVVVGPEDQADPPNPEWFSIMDMARTLMLWLVPILLVMAFILKTLFEPKWLWRKFRGKPGRKTAQRTTRVRSSLY